MSLNNYSVIRNTDLHFVGPENKILQSNEPNDTVKTQSQKRKFTGAKVYFKSKNKIRPSCDNKCRKTCSKAIIDTVKPKINTFLDINILGRPAVVRQL